ncbi:MAG: hypothetical protein JXR83_21655 [Deltaproteobacteria bacterium]|nr:hypothetical protein [Deltaproteobacteria bacterium]
MRACACGLLAIVAGAAACVTTGKEAPPPKEDPFAGCQAHPAGVGGWQLRCGGVLASSNFALNYTPDQLLESFSAGMTASGEAAGNRVEWEESALKIGGKDQPVRAFRISRPADDKTLFRGHAIAVATSNEGARVVTCGAPTEVPMARERCRAMLEVLCQSGVPESVPRAALRVQGPPTILGRALIVPEGCRTLESTGERASLTCGNKSEDASFTWFLLDQGGGLQFLDLMVQQIVTGLGSEAEARVESTACQVEGTSAECRRVEGRDALGDFRLLAASATVRGDNIVVMCSYHGEQPHPVCNDVFGAAAPASAPASAPESGPESGPASAPVAGGDPQT